MILEHFSVFKWWVKTILLGRIKKTNISEMAKMDGTDMIQDLLCRNIVMMEK